MTIKLRRIDYISEVATLRQLDSVDVGIPGRAKRLFITEALDILQLKMRWLKRSPDITCLTIIEGRYIYCPGAMCRWLGTWSPILHVDAQGQYAYIDHKEYCSFSDASSSFDHNLIILPEYYGDYSFHFGHFQVDVVPILKFLKKIQASQLGARNIKYSLYPLLNFHKEIIEKEDLSCLISVENNTKILKELAFADNKRIIWLEKTNSRLVLPDHNYGWAKAISSASNKTQAFSNETNPSPTLREAKTEFKGLVFDRSGSSNFLRATNCCDLLCNEFLVETEHGEKRITFESIDYIQAGVFGRIDIALKYDFVIGPFGSHFMPTLLRGGIVHMFIVPFRPPATLIEERMEGFTYYPSGLIRWILASHPTQYEGGFDMWSFHYSEYAIDANYVASQIAMALTDK